MIFELGLRIYQNLILTELISNSANSNVSYESSYDRGKVINNIIKYGRIIIFISILSESSGLAIFFGIKTANLNNKEKETK